MSHHNVSCPIIEKLIIFLYLIEPADQANTSKGKADGAKQAEEPQPTEEGPGEAEAEVMVEEQKLVNITLVDLNKRKINLKVSIFL